MSLQDKVAVSMRTVPKVSVTHHYCQDVGHDRHSNSFCFGTISLKQKAILIHSFLARMGTVRLFVP